VNYNRRKACQAEGMPLCGLWPLDCQVEGMVGDAAVDVHAPVVLSAGESSGVVIWISGTDASAAKERVA